jgi:hypothetical protein
MNLYFVNCSFPGSDPVIAPSNRLDVKEATDAITLEAAVELFDKLLVLAAVT